MPPILAVFLCKGTATFTIFTSKYTKVTPRYTEVALRRCPTGVELHYLQCNSIEYNYIYLYIFT